MPVKRRSFRSVTRRRKYVRRSKKSVIRRRSSSVRALAKKVATLRKNTVKVEQKFYRSAWSGVINNLNSGGSYVGPTVVPVTNYREWTGLFGAQGFNGANPNPQMNEKMKHYSSLIRLRMLASSEDDLINHKVYVVRPRRAVAAYYTWSTGSLAITNGNHYDVSYGLGGTSSGIDIFNAILNPRMFKVYSVKTFKTGDDARFAYPPGSGGGQAIVTPDSSTRKEWVVKVPMKGTIVQPPYHPGAGMTIIQPGTTGSTAIIGTNTGLYSWKQLSGHVDVAKQIYILCFNNDAPSDLETVKLEVDIIHRVGQMGDNPF